MTDTLRLRANDEDDLRILAAMVQDALVPLGDMMHLEGERRFVMAVNRFRWEKGARVEKTASADGHERTHSLVSVANVARVRVAGFDQHERDVVHSLLALTPAENAVEFTFAGRGRIRVEIDAIDVSLRDVGEPWPTQWKPGHEAE